MKCPHCGKSLEDVPRIAFKATCDHCGAYLHSCVNCRNYKPGMPNDCLVPGTEYIADREKANYCEEFALLGTGPKGSGSPNDAAKKLFGDSDAPKKRGFDSLF